MRKKKGFQKIKNLLKVTLTVIIQSMITQMKVLIDINGEKCIQCVQWAHEECADLEEMVLHFGTNFC